MKKKSFLQIAVILMASFAAWIYCIAVVVLGLIYQAYPGQEHIAVLISTLPTLVMMLSAFASSVLLRFCNRKYVVIISMLISIGAGLLILFLELPLAGVILCSALLGVPAGTIGFRQSHGAGGNCAAQTAGQGVGLAQLHDDAGNGYFHTAGRRVRKDRDGFRMATKPCWCCCLF